MTTYTAKITYLMRVDGELVSREYAQDVTDSMREGADTEDLLEGMGFRLSSQPGFHSFASGFVAEE
jgi:hypothetical protein